jgi:hypothetical protein
MGVGRARAVFRPGYGCALAHGGEPEPLPPLPPIADVPWPEALKDSPKRLRRVDYEEIDSILDEAFADEVAAHRAVVMIVDGRLVVERYAPGFEAATPLLSWSVAKSVTATIVGAAVLHDYVQLDEPFPAREWREPHDPRWAITLNDLLRMQSGLAFDEAYSDAGSDVVQMLFRARDAGAIAAAQPLEHEPGEVWDYSSGTTNLMVRTLREVLAQNGADIPRFARERVFAPIGAASVTLETDASGSPIGSSFVYATARDYAKLGQLYLQDGVWNGERLLPDGWTDYVRKATPASNGQYGAHFWLNEDGEGRIRFVPGLPEDAFFMSGHEGQYVFILPHKSAIIVRFGMTRGAAPLDLVGPVVEKLAAAISDLPLAEPATP